MDLFDGKLSFDELEELDLPRLTSLIEAKIQLINEKEEDAKKSQQKFK